MRAYPAGDRVVEGIPEAAEHILEGAAGDSPGERVEDSSEAAVEDSLEEVVEGTPGPAEGTLEAAEGIQEAAERIPVVLEEHILQQQPNAYQSPDSWLRARQLLKRTLRGSSRVLALAWRRWIIRHVCNSVLLMDFAN